LTRTSAPGQENSASRNIPNKEELEDDVARLQLLLYALGRRRSLRDPIASICE
jgi:hypothetical protein